jgi:DNA-binding CsgD family transcriptional regulator
LIIKSAKAAFSRREHDILCWGAEGNISTNTVRFHWKNILRKIGANGRTYAIAKAIRQHIITPASIRVAYPEG